MAACIQTFEQVIEQVGNTTQTINFLVTETADVLIAGNCTFNQNTSIEYTSQMVTNATIDVVLSQATVQDAMTQWDTAIKQSNKGINLTIIIVIVVVVVIVIIAIALMAKYLPGLLAKQKAAREAKKAYLLANPLPKTTPPKAGQNIPLAHPVEKAPIPLAKPVVKPSIPVAKPVVKPVQKG